MGAFETRPGPPGGSLELPVPNLTKVAEKFK